MKIIKLPVPIFLEKPITECEIMRPSTGVIMQTKKVMETGNYFLALKKFLAGTILIDDDPEKTNRLVGELPVQTAEYLAINVILLEFPDDDGVEGVYICPRCGEQKICECVDGIDTRNFISELPVNYFSENDNQEITKDVDIELLDKRTKKILLEVSSITMRFPILKDFIEAVNVVGVNNETDIQKKVYVNCITKMNNTEFTREQKNRYGTKIIDNMSIRNLNHFADEIVKFGMATVIDQVCLKCGKKWKVRLNTSNFFALALQ